MRIKIFSHIIGLFLCLFAAQNVSAVIRDGGIDPANLGKGEWLFSIKDATNQLHGHIKSVTNEVSLMQYYKANGIRWIVLKAGTGTSFYDGCYASPCQITSNLCYIAHTNGLWLFGYNRNYGTNVPGEVAIANYCFNQGADGFIWDAEAELEAQNLGAYNGPAVVWSQCSQVRSNWPNKFLAHSPGDIISFHSTFPHKEFGFWCDAVMPQVYHHSAQDSALKTSASAGMNWADANWGAWQNGLYGTSSNQYGQTIYWTNAIKPLCPARNVYGEVMSVPAGTSECNGSATPYPDKDIGEFMDYLSADPNCVTAGGYKGFYAFRSDLRGTNQWAYFKEATVGDFTNIVSNIVLDDNKGAVNGSWNNVVVFATTAPNSPQYYGVTGTDTNSFGTNYWFKGKGAGSDYIQFRPTIVTSGDYKLYQWHPYRADASTNVPFVVAYNGGTNTVFANQKTNDGRWSYVGTFPFAAGTNGNIRITDGISEAGGVSMIDGIKLIFLQASVVATAPAAPSGLVATAFGPTQIDLRWQDNSTNESSFIIARSLLAGGPFLDVGTNSAGVTNFSNTGLSPLTTYYYVVRARNAVGDSANSNVASAMTTSGAPQIAQQPQSQTLAVAQTATFNVTATGIAPLSYQWRLNGVNISNATTNSYSRTNLNFSDAGSYSVYVSNLYGNTTSSNAVLTVVPATPPGIVSQPQSQTILGGQTAVFTVGVSGSSPFGFQWYKNGSVVSGANSSSLVRGNAQVSDAGSYFVVVTNVAGSATSSTAFLGIRFSLGIATIGNGGVSKSPDLPSYAPDAIVSLTPLALAGTTFDGWSGDAAGTDEPLTVVMTTNKNITATFVGGVADIIVDNVDSGFSTTGTWTAQSSSTDKYGADYKFASVTGGAATATAKYTPNIAYTGYYDVYIWYPQGGNRSSNAPWTVNYVGGSVTTNVNQQINGGDWRLIASTKKFIARGSAHAILGNNASASIVMADAAKFVYSSVQAPVIVAQPQSQTVKYGGNTTLTVSAVGSTSFDYQWFLNDSPIANATDSSYTLNSTPFTAAGDYTVLVSDEASSLLSDPATLTVEPSAIWFGAPEILPGGQVHLTVLGDPVNFVLEVTTNLSIWEPLTNGTIGGGAADFYYPITNGPSRLYRGRIGQ